MDEITFRAVTPIFYFELLPRGAEYRHSGTFKIVRDGRYIVSLKRYPDEKTILDELLQYVDEDARGPLLSIRTHAYIDTDYFLVVDVTYPLTDELRIAGLSRELDHIHTICLDVLRLHTSHGIVYHPSYFFHSLPHPNTGRRSLSVRSTPITNQYLFSFAVTGPSTLSESEFENCTATLETMLRRNWNDSVTFDKVLTLALEYHKTTFILQRAEHRFLLLMVICDALFKKENERNASQAARRISELLSTTQSDQPRVQKEFFDRATQSFYRLRNAAAHGDPNLDRDNMETKYWALYHYITKAIIALISIPDGKLDWTIDYYDEISRYIENRFNGLPPS